MGRSVAGLPLVLLLQLGQPALAWVLLLLAGLSDAADGWLARRAGGGSSWGARLDPLADKLLLAAPMIWLASNVGSFADAHIILAGGPGFVYAATDILIAHGIDESHLAADAYSHAPRDAQ